MKSVIMNQIVGTLISFFIFAILVFFAVSTKKTIFIILSVILGALTLLFTLNSIKVIKQEKGIRVKHNINYTYIICLIIICCLFGGCLTLLIKNYSFRINGVETTATVYDVNKTLNYKTEYDDDGNPYNKKEENCDVYIKYNAKDKEYKTKLDVSSCDQSIGDKIKIYYDKDNPEKFASNSIGILLFATMFSGGALLIFIVATIKSLKKKQKNIKN